MESINQGYCTDYRTNITIPLRTPVQLPDPFDTVSIDDLFPDLWPKAVAEHESHGMLPIDRFGGLREKVAAYFANVLRCRAFVLDAVVPESGSGEFWTDHRGGTGEEDLADAWNSSID